jgi:hypothetical protein
MAAIQQKAKTMRERAEDAVMSEVLGNDMLRLLRIDDPSSRNKYFADRAAGDIEKYSPINPKPNYGGIENTLNSPITPQNRCGFCDWRPTNGVKLMRCVACKARLYCDRECQKNDWKFHKKGCALIQSDPKGLGDALIGPIEE